MSSIGALGRSEDAITNIEATLLAHGCRRWDGKDGAGKLSASDPWEGWLVLILALDLEQVEEIGARGVDFD